MHFSRRQLAALGAFRDIPGNPAAWIKADNPKSTSYVDEMMSEPDGFAQVPDFMARWNAALVLSNRAKSLFDDPAAGDLRQTEAQLSSAVLTGLKTARTYWPYGSGYYLSRSPTNQAALTAALNATDNALANYLNIMPGKIALVEEAAAARQAGQVAIEQTEQQAVIATNVASLSLSKKSIMALERDTASIDLERSTYATKAAEQKVAEVGAVETYQDAVKAAQAPKVLGMPLNTALLLGGAAAAVYFLTKKRSA